MILNKPIKVGNMKLRNRLVMPSMTTLKSTADGMVTRKLCDHYRERAAGGSIGVVITEHCFVSQQGKAYDGQISVADDSTIPGLRQLAETIHDCGTPIFAQISHAGGLASANITGQKLAAASAVKNPAKTHSGALPRALSELEIQDIVEQFAQAASRVRTAGFDGVEIHAAHAYLLNEFYSPLTNHRADIYGGGLENRLRIHIEIIRKVRASAGADFPIAVRFGGCDYMTGGNNIQTAVNACRILECEGVNLLDISGGMCRYIRSDCREAGYFSDTSKEIMRAVSTPVLLTGGITRRDDAETLLQDGAADLIGVGRALLGNPAWARECM